MSYVDDEEAPAIYSPLALFWFSAIFGPLAGGIMAFQSLRTVGQFSIARYVLWASIGCFALLWIGGLFISYSALLGLAVGIVWGVGLWFLLKKRVANEAQLPRKSIVPPLRICLYIVAALIIFACVRIQLGF